MIMSFSLAAITRVHLVDLMNVESTGWRPTHRQSTPTWVGHESTSWLLLSTRHRHVVLFVLRELLLTFHSL